MRAAAFLLARKLEPVRRGTRQHAMDPAFLLRTKFELSVAEPRFGAPHPPTKNKLSTCASRYRALETQSEDFGITSTSLCDPVGITRITLGLFSDHFRITLGSSWYHFGITFGSLSDYFGITRGSLSDHVRSTFGIRICS